MLTDQKLKLARSEAALEAARCSAAKTLRDLRSEKEATARAKDALDAAQATLSRTEERLEEVWANRKSVWESSIELKKQVVYESKLASEREALSRAQEGSELLLKSLEES